MATEQPKETPKTSATPKSNTIHRAIVKSVLSGDTIIVRGQPRGGPPPEKTISLAGINAPRIGRQGRQGEQEVKDEPFAWESREFLREKIVGKEVAFTVDYTVPSGREFVRLHLPIRGPDGNPTLGDNLAEQLIAEGLAEVRVGQRGLDDYTTKLDNLQTEAKAGKKGKWEGQAAEHIREIQWQIEDLRALVEHFKQKPQKAVIEHVRDGSTIRALLLPEFQYVTLMLSGIKAPTLRLGAGGEVVEKEQFADEAKYFTESRLLQRDVEVVLESYTNQNFVGSVLHPNGNIAELLLREGLAKCLDWSIGTVTGGPEKYRAAESAAKSKRLRLWRNYVPNTVNTMSDSSRSFTAKVVEIGFGDNLLVMRDGQKAPQKIFLSSIRPPKNPESRDQTAQGKQFRPLYDIPYMFQAREFMRKKLIGKKVQVYVDYIQPKNDNFPEKTQCTVKLGTENIAEQLLTMGLATVMRYRADDENRSSNYDALLAAEAQAEKVNLRVHSLKVTPSADSEAPVATTTTASSKTKDESATIRVQDLSGDAQKSKGMFPFLQRVGKTDAIVEFVSSGSRLRVYSAKENCLFNILLAGITCPRSQRQQGTQVVAGEPYGQEALDFVRLKCLQHDVQVEVESMDKSGNMIGWVFLHEENLSEALVRTGLASIHFSAERSRYYSKLLSAEAEAKSKRINIWKDWEEPAADTSAVEDELSKVTVNGSAPDVERKTDFKRVLITECTPAGDRLRVAMQKVDDGAGIELLMNNLRSEIQNHPPTRGTYTPRKNDVCAALFSVDNQWYRAKIENVNKNGTADVLYIDFGNRETVDVASKLMALPDSLKSQRAFATEFTLAYVSLARIDEEGQIASARYVQSVTMNNDISLNVEYKQATGGDAVTLCKTSLLKTTEQAGSSNEQANDSESLYSADVGLELIAQGYALADIPPRQRRHQTLYSKYTKAQEQAKKQRLALWKYGDFTSDDM